MTRLTRRHFLGQSAAMGLIGLAAPLAAQDSLRFKIGSVLPGRTGPEFIRASINDIIGSAARNGAQLADIGVITAAPPPLALDLLYASSPTPEAAIRAGERLVEAQGVKALIGGVGEGQAEALAEIARRTGVLVLNIGGTSDALRALDIPTLFHIEASDAMYLDALGQLAAQQGHLRWAVVSDSSVRGKALAARAGLAAEKAGCTIAGTVEILPSYPVYADKVAELAAIEADVVVLLADVYDQTAFLIDYEVGGGSLPVLNMPHTLTQTRDYIASARRHAPAANPRSRIALWETTDPRPEAADFNLQIRARYAEPADPTAWAAHSAVKILAEAVAATGSNDPAVIAAHLVAPETRFDLAKGLPLSFRPWDRQLRQPLAVVSVDQESEWKLLDLSSHINVAGYGGQIPADLAGGDTALDTLGDLAG